MTRGPLPEKGLLAAMPIANLRGTVMHYRREEPEADFGIIGAGPVVMVRVKRTRRLHCSIQEIEHEYSEAIVMMRSFPAAADIYRELWLWSQNGRWRFFRITDSGLVEIDRDGKIRIASRAGPVATADPVPVENAGRIA